MKPWTAALLFFLLSSVAPLFASPLPLTFEENRGQFDPAVRLVGRGDGYVAFLTPEEAVLVVAPPGAGGTRAVLRMRMAGASANPVVTPEGREEGTFNHFRGRDPDLWRTGVPHYRQARYRQVYPSIDVVYYGSGSRLEYDFVVEPGGDPDAIRILFDGAKAMRLDGRGDLVLDTAAGPVVQHKPVAWQETAAGRLPVDARYALHDGEVHIDLGAYDRRNTLVIDPVLSYSTYLGGSGVDFAQGITVGSDGSAYVTGYTLSTNFPTTAGALQRSLGGGDRDAFVTKISADGTRLVYSTYVGGNNGDAANSIAVDAAGNAYVTGGTTSTNFPTQNAFQSTNRGDSDAFLFKLSPGGDALVYSTYLGGSGSDTGYYRLAVDAAGSAYITGHTTSANFPTANAFQSSLRGPTDYFVTKFSADGTSLVYSTYLGGSGEETRVPVLGNGFGNGVAVDSAGSAYVTGATVSTDFPVVNPIAQHRGGSDAFVAKLAPNGSSLVYSTFLGGTADDIGFVVAVDGSGAAYVAGATASANFPTTALQRNLRGSADGFVTKLNPAGSAIVYSTFLGGGGIDFAEDIAVDAAGSAYVSGFTQSSDFPIKDAFQNAYGGQSLGLFEGDAFVTKLNADGSDILFSSFLGGSGDEFGAIAIDAAGNAYLAGNTSSNNFPTMNPIQANNAGGSLFIAAGDAFVTKVASGTTQAPAPAIASIAPNSGPAGGGTNVTITGTNFVSGATVTIGGTAATNVTVASATTITASTPARAAGAADVVVRNPDGQSATLTGGFTYTAAPAPAPSVASIAPSSGPTAGGTNVAITGSDFVSGATVTIGGTAATNVAVVSATTITATTPARAAGAADVVVRNPDGQSATLAGGFTYTAAPAPAPSVASIAPSSGPTAGGTNVTITGSDFVSGATVTIGGTAATNATVVSATTITATTPARGAGAADVVVRNPDGQSATLTGGFTYTAAPAPAPTVASIAPNTGPTGGGTNVTITGTDFVSGATVTIGGIAATNVSVASATTITATTPARAAGAADVVVRNPDGQSATLTGGFTYTAPPPPAPAVASVSPSRGPLSGGTVVTITGSNFAAGATVTIGGTAATGVTVVSATTISAMTPPRATPGAVDVVVRNADGQSATLAGAFTYEVPPPPALAIDSITPSSGPATGGTHVTIRGTGFTSAAAITFGGVPARSITFVDAQTIVAVTPAHRSGRADVTLRQGNVTLVVPNGFLFQRKGIFF